MPIAVRPLRPRRAARSLLLPALLGAAAAAPPPPAAPPPLLTLVSVSSDGALADGASSNASISASGRWIAFQSDATNLVPGDTNANSDIFLRDRSKGTTTRESVGSFGTQGVGDNQNPSLSLNGRFLAFDSDAFDLVAGDDNGLRDVFWHDCTKGTTTLVSVASDGTQSNGTSQLPSISANGSLVAFESDATTLVAGDTNGHRDVFVRDLKHGTVTRVSVSTAGDEGDGDSSSAVISGNGRFVAFESDAGNLDDFDTNAFTDVFVHDLKTGTTVLASKNADFVAGDDSSFARSLSTNGRYLVLDSLATNLVVTDTNGLRDVFLRDLKLGANQKASLAPGDIEGDGSSMRGTVSANGKRIAFSTNAANLFSNDTDGVSDVVLRDLKFGATNPASVPFAVHDPDAGSSQPVLSANGRWVAFQSSATNLVEGDSNGVRDVFVRDMK
jgi:Tol biopolymer transport system component